jgi:cellulose biosynthesis protein BcsQ
MFVSDIIIVPCKPSNADIWSTDTTFTLLTDARRINTKLKIFGLFNMVDPTVKATEDIPKLVKALETDYNIRFFKTRIHNRIQYNYTLGMGLGIMEQICDSKAIKEFKSLYKEVCDAGKSEAKSRS